MESLFGTPPEVSRSAAIGRFNADMLATARCARSMSQAELAERLGVSQPLVGKWEAALSAPDEEQVARLAAVLAVQPAFFYVDRSRRLASMSDFYHRALSTASRGDVKAVQARCSIIDIQIDRLLSMVDMPLDRIPNIDLQALSGDIEIAAERARLAMGAPSGPIDNLARLIEDCGAIVVDRNFEVNEIDALCRWVPELPKIFFINGSRPADRIRFSLAHELGHTILHFGRDLDHAVAERQADAFASAFLLPRSEFLRDMKGSLSLPDLAALKRKWRVSMQAIARRAHSLGAIDDSRFKSICVQMARNGWRKSEPVTVAGETPRMFGHLLRANLEAGLTRSELAQLLFIGDSELLTMMRDEGAPTWEQQGVRLRLVR